MVLVPDQVPQVVFNLPQAEEMSQTGLTWVLGLVLLWLVLLGKANEISPLSPFLHTPVNVTIESGQNVTFQCAVSSAQKNASVVFYILRNGAGRDITCPGGSKVLLEPRIQAHCSSEDGTFVAIWTINEVTEQDNRTQVLCSVPGQSNITAFLTVNVLEVDSSLLIGGVLGGFLGTLLFFALIACGLVTYARCMRVSDDDEKYLNANSFSNPSWTGSTDGADGNISKSSAENVSAATVCPSCKEPPERRFPSVDPIGKLSESRMDIASL